MFENTRAPYVPLFISQDYPKLSAAYYTLLEILTQDHIQFISSLEPNVSHHNAKILIITLHLLGDHIHSFLNF